ncbi:BQ2448_1946 [Microbotryum intermedium]|uniref:BQ2448_1946 protein n=1 Tax=Microbotryum intermedium TaxID=269621 RepID=A0A238FCV6_9BASI|nr:BQ2448_1946 [Microbotryum intermedium]
MVAIPSTYGERADFLFGKIIVNSTISTSTKPYSQQLDPKKEDIPVAPFLSMHHDKSTIDRPWQRSKEGSPELGSAMRRYLPSCARSWRRK